ncbi:Serine threonine-protein kinase [Lasiodiplodia theobromae]|uniref:Serine threonine-protein kinase n=1 Tax=Lasiodiplodia theobromae TaxID=45133 RepID=UPI0015C2FE09|nr:Serine threonine-protein kinase [Lasiodiplodia theobromae]KAF4541852.1 Serine threonine-protein kinase [Lasiodiplodia theobromae]
MVDSFINPEKMIGAIYLTYYDQGDLTGYVKNHRESGTPIANDITWNIFTNICAALAYCHHGIRSPHDDANPPPTWSAIIHRDIKTDNIFLQSNPTAPGNIIAILGDFDWSTNLSLERTIYRRPTDGSSYQSPADPRWLPPESPRYTMASDVWGLGAVVTCMCRLVASPEECQVSDGVPPSSSSGGRLGPALQRLVKRAVAWEPRERLSAWGLWRGIVEAEAGK